MAIWRYEGTSIRETNEFSDGLSKNHYSTPLDYASLGQDEEAMSFATDVCEAPMKPPMKVDTIYCLDWRTDLIVSLLARSTGTGPKCLWNGLSLKIYKERYPASGWLQLPISITSSA